MNTNSDTATAKGATRRSALATFGGLSAALGFAGVAKAGSGAAIDEASITDGWAAMLTLLSVHPNGRAAVHNAIAAGMNPTDLGIVMFRDPSEPNRPDWPVLMFHTKSGIVSIGPDGVRSRS